MASPSTATRKRTHTALDADDAMAMRAAELAAWAGRNVRTILIVFGVVLAAAVVAFFIRYQNQAKADQAATQWLSVQAAAQQGTGGVAQLTSFATTYDGTPEADEARLALATMYMDQNQPQRAVNEARRVAEGGGLLAYQGRMLLGAALAAAGQRDQAVAAFTTAASESDLLYQRQEARSEAALVHEQAGNWAAAAQMYRSMLADAKEGSTDRAVVELRIAEAEAHLVGRR
jgi:hypothetical protein